MAGRRTAPRPSRRSRRPGAGRHAGPAPRSGTSRSRRRADAQAADDDHHDQVARDVALFQAGRSGRSVACVWRSAPVTLLVLRAGSAPARIVAPDPGTARGEAGLRSAAEEPVPLPRSHRLVTERLAHRTRRRGCRRSTAQDRRTADAATPGPVPPRPVHRRRLPCPPRRCPRPTRSSPPGPAPARNAAAPWASEAATAGSPPPVTAG